MPERNPVQNESMFSLGNAMSRAPIMSGMRKFPKHPTMTGMTTKKIMRVACIVNSMLYTSGGMTPSVSRKSQWSPGTGDSGHPSSQRISMARKPPIRSMNSPRKRNCRPIIL